MNGTRDLNKNDIETLIYKNGGTFIQAALGNAIVIGSDDGELCEHKYLTSICN